jgi:hypothetical protein
MGVSAGVKALEMGVSFCFHNDSNGAVGSTATGAEGLMRVWIGV